MTPELAAEKWNRRADLCHQQLAAERERCARLAESCAADGSPMLHNLAAEIRSGLAADLSPSWLPAGEWPKVDGECWLFNPDGAEVGKYSIERGLAVYRPVSEGSLSIGSPKELARIGYRFRPCEPTPEPPEDNK